MFANEDENTNHEYNPQPRSDEKKSDEKARSAEQEITAQDLKSQGVPHPTPAGSIVTRLHSSPEQKKL